MLDAHHTMRIPCNNATIGFSQQSFTFYDAQLIKDQSSGFVNIPFVDTLIDSAQTLFETVIYRNENQQYKVEDNNKQFKNFKNTAMF